MSSKVAKQNRHANGKFWSPELNLAENDSAKAKNSFIKR
jgi:hypothetical protein